MSKKKTRVRLKDIAPTKTVSVSAACIAGAVRKDSHHCMIADAIAQAVPDAQYISVDRRSTRFSDADKRYVYLTPPTAGDKLTAFDKGHAVTPFRVLLTEGYSMPRGWQAKHAHSSRKGKRYGGKKRGRKVGTHVTRTRLDGYRQVTA